jgi:hypothetical protein
MNKKIIYIILAILIIPNLPIISPSIAASADDGYYQYANRDGSFTMTTSFKFKRGGGNASRIHFRFELFVKETNPAPENRTLYRIYTLNPLYFWRWFQHYNLSRHFPYMDWDEIKKRRGYDKTPREQLNNEWQSF